MISKVIFFVENVFTSRDYKRYGIELFQERGLVVEVWDLSPILHQKYFNQQKGSELEKFEIRRIFHTSHLILKAISELSENCVAISVVNLTPQSLSIYRALSKTGTILGLLSNNAVPPRHADHGVAKIIKNKLEDKISLRRIFNGIFRRLPVRVLGVKPADFVIAGGTRSLDNAMNKYAQLFSPSTETVWAHTMDFDTYLSSKETEPVETENIGVFIDQNFAFHPDRFWKKRLSFDIDIDEYFHALRKFFSYLEDALEIRVVIAAHPKSNYDTLPDYFGGREMIKGNTAQLVRKSQLIITHYSTAVNFSILFSKPVIFVTTRGLKGTFRQGYIRTMSRLLKKEIILADDPGLLNYEDELSVDQDAFLAYKEEYIKRCGSSEKYLWDIVIEYLEKRNEQLTQPS